MSRLKFRQDDWSIQLTLPGAPRFFVRLERAASDDAVAVFSDFLFGEDELADAVEALHSLAGAGELGTGDCLLVFKDIHPGNPGDPDHPELTDRQGRLIQAVDALAGGTGRQIDAFNLARHGTRFDAIVHVQ